MKKIVICGITSAITTEVARLLSPGNQVVVAARNSGSVEAIGKDLKLWGAKEVIPHVLDFTNLESVKIFKAKVEEELGALDLLFVSYGTLSDQERCQSDLDYAISEFQTNGLSQIALLQQFAPMMSKGSTMAVVTSVAGDRGRGSNFYYGSAKGAVSIFLSGLRAEMSKMGIHVLDVRPGFVDTPMTAHVPKNFLFAKPEKVAKDIAWAISRRRAVLYTPFFWKYIMCIIKALPLFIFNRLKL
ncbi:MAG: short-chain dehydrogenase [Bdellovibrionaceae bacterium]|nr:short-chain dehydrogenase [Pseudobdellovibrionaceae bacterium]|tara:strand:+ start:1826 stop:2554 length:729 start_codon:yes stop_codon:yes gene_type:complete